MQEAQPQTLSIPFQGRIIHIPQHTMLSHASTPNILVRIGSGEGSLTDSTIKGYEYYMTTYHMEYEICRQSEHDQASQTYTAAHPALSDVVFVIPSETIQADIFTLLIRSVPIDLIEFVELQDPDLNSSPREVISFTNCLITNARRYNRSWDANIRNNLLLISFCATQWSINVSAVDQGNQLVGTGAASHYFETR